MSQRGGVRIEGRVVPFPRSISEMAQQALARIGEPGWRPANLYAAFPAANDVEGWAQRREVAERHLLELFAPIVPYLKSTRETVTLGGVTVHVATPARDAWPQDRIYIDIHGGALLDGGGEVCALQAQMLADQHGVRCFGIDYRMPPEHPYPAPLDDCVAAYRALLERFDTQHIVVGGASAGGNLAAATVLRARDEGLPLPAALVLLTPEVDLTESGDSFETNRALDVVLPAPLMDANLIYAGGQDLAHPYLSPLFGDFTRGFPPTFLQTGTRDLFLSNTVRMHRALRRAGVPVELHVFEGMPHGGFMGAPEDLELAEEVARFVGEHLGGQR